MSSATLYRIGAKQASDLFAKKLVDLFAGGGGASMGIERAIGRAVDLAINHDRKAIECHTINHPHTRHLCEDVRRVDPDKAMGDDEILLLWASPDCAHFSKAKGGRPVKKKIRGLAWVVTRWAQKRHPDVIMLENVEEFKDWGPLVHCKLNGKKQYDKFGGRVMVPDKTRKGRYFRKWLQLFRDEGYQVQHRELRACDYGGNTTRKRFFLIARCDGLPIVWPAPTLGPKLKRGVKRKLKPGVFVKASPPLKPYRSAAECIDWSLPCPSIFMSRDGAREFEKATGIRCNRPLAPKTMDRIGMGMWKYVLNNPSPFIVRTDHGGDHFRGQSINKPLSTVTGHHGYALVEPYLVQRYGEGPHQETRGQTVDRPLHTITPNNNSGVLVAAFLAKHFGGHTTPGSSVEQPLNTITGKDHHSLVAAQLLKFRGDSAGSDVADPMPTVTAGGQSARDAGAAHAMGIAVAHMIHMNHGDKQWSSVGEPLRTVVAGGKHHGLVTAHLLKNNHGSHSADPNGPLHTITTGGRHALVYAFLVKYFGTNIGQRCDEPLQTITARDRFGLITVTIGGVEWIIVDIGMRMLQPRELLAAQFTPKLAKKYVLIGSKAQQTRMIGNSVPPVLAEVLVRANVVERVAA